MLPPLSSSSLSVAVADNSSDLSALEALGGVTNICSDKTGTLTQGAMIVKKAWLPSSAIYTVHDSKDPNNPDVGRVTSAQAGQEKPEVQRDYDQERTTQAIKFNVPDGKGDPKPSKQAESEAT